jgi:hypothetical protein
MQHKVSDEMHSKLNIGERPLLHLHDEKKDVRGLWVESWTVEKETMEDSHVVWMTASSSGSCTDTVLYSMLPVRETRPVSETLYQLFRVLYG